MKKSMGPRIMLFPVPVLVVGTYDGSGRPNVATVAWGGMCCTKPPCIGISLRKATYTYENIVEKKAFTISITTEPHVKEADYFGIVSGRTIDKFSSTGLTPVRGEHVDAPYIKEFPFVLECRLLHSIEIGSHTQFIGEILDTKIEEEMIADNGFPDIKKLKPVAYTPEIKNYYSFGDILGRAFSIGKKYRDG